MTPEEKAQLAMQDAETESTENLLAAERLYDLLVDGEDMGECLACGRFGILEDGYCEECTEKIEEWT